MAGIETKGVHTLEHRSGVHLAQRPCGRRPRGSLAACSHLGAASAAASLSSCVLGAWRPVGGEFPGLPERFSRDLLREEDGCRLRGSRDLLREEDGCRLGVDGLSRDWLRLGSPSWECWTCRWVLPRDVPRGRLVLFAVRGGLARGCRCGSAACSQSATCLRESRLACLRYLAISLATVSANHALEDLICGGLRHVHVSRLRRPQPSWPWPPSASPPWLTW